MSLQNANKLFREANEASIYNKYSEAVALFDAAVAEGLLFDGISEEAADGFAIFRADCVARAEAAKAISL